MMGLVEMDESKINVDAQLILSCVVILCDVYPSYEIFSQFYRTYNKLALNNLGKG
jgi:hypothetical protein